MKNNTFIFISIVVLISGCIENQSIIQSINVTTSNNTREYIIENNPLIINNTLYNESYPIPDYIPISHSYDVNTDHDIWYAQNPSSYITPENEWVKYTASQLFVDKDGRIKYKNIMVRWLSDENGTVLLWTNKLFENDYNYSIYNESHHIASINNLPWLMPDFYLYHGNQGVCSAWANAVTSLMLSGEMSLKEGDTFIKQVIPAKTILGYTKDGLRDAWSEYQAYNKTWITSTMMLKVSFQDTEIEGMLWEEKGTSEMKNIYEFTDKYFKRI